MQGVNQYLFSSNQNKRQRVIGVKDNSTVMPYLLQAKVYNLLKKWLKSKNLEEKEIIEFDFALRDMSLKTIETMYNLIKEKGEEYVVKNSFNDRRILKILKYYRI